MSKKSYKYKVEHKNFISMQDGFKDCVRYCNAKVISISMQKGTAVIEITLKNPSMRKEALQLYINRWESFGFKLIKI